VLDHGEARTNGRRPDGHADADADDRDPAGPRATRPAARIGLADSPAHSGNR
jgi:hypothetical protein